jgi:RES domain-containing protein
VADRRGRLQLTAPGVLWRISNRADLTGLGGEKADGRWHTAAHGKRIVYLAEHPALALVEVLANLHGDPRLLPEAYQLIKIRCEQGMPVEAFDDGSLSAQWRDDFEETQVAGDAWLARGSAALLAVPSGPSPESVNYLLNPLHADARRIGIEWSKWIGYDRRLFGIRDILPAKRSL